MFTYAGLKGQINVSRLTRVMHIFSRMDRGGAELRTVDLLRRLPDSAGVGFDFVAISGRPGTLDDDIRSLGGCVHYCRLDLVFPLRFYWLLRMRQPDVVHSHVYLTSGLMLFIAALARVPVRVAHFRTTGTDAPRTRRQRFLDGVNRFLLNRCATHILAVSEGALQHLWGEAWNRDSRCRVIYPGIAPSNSHPLARQDLRAMLGVSDDTHIYIHVGRMEPPKNHLRLVQIFREVHRRDPNAVLVVVGRGGNDLESEIRSAIIELGLIDHVHFVGERNDVRRLLAAADVMIFPSLREGLPGAVLEAISEGVPVVASRLPGVEEIARILRGVTMLELADSDAIWAGTAVDLATTRESVSIDLRGTAFDIDVSLQEHMRVWNAGL